MPIPFTAASKGGRVAEAVVGLTMNLPHPIVKFLAMRRTEPEAVVEGTLLSPQMGWTLFALGVGGVLLCLYALVKGRTPARAVAVLGLATFVLGLILHAKWRSGEW